MSSEPNSVPGNSNNWFSPNVEYEGCGRAEFSDPRINLEGYFRIKFDEFGSHSIVMDVTDVDVTLSTDIPYIPPEFKIPSLMALLNGETPIEIPLEGAKKATKWRWPITGKKTNPCTTLKVVTSDGIFYASENIYYNQNFNYDHRIGHQMQLTFHQPLHSQFESEDAGSASYWILPISNFISKFMQIDSELKDHPLRINPDGELIIFEFNNGKGFIEPLMDYKDREEKLTGGTERNITTAVMVGEIGPKLSCQFSDISQWFPFDFLSLLGLATGSEVGAPWIEFRDARGKLVRRMHLIMGRPSFSKGHRNIDEVTHRGTGTLLTKYQLSEHSGNTYLTSTLKHIIRGGLSGLSIEDNMSHIFRAFDGLCEHYGLKTQDLSQNLDPIQKTLVKGALKKAAGEIRNEAIKSSCKPDQKEALTRIAARTDNACNTDRNFGFAAIDLINQFKLNDAKITDAYYLTTPRSDRRMWYEVLSHYRGVVIHQGFFDFDTGKYDFEDVLRIEHHLLDILIRIVLKMLCYDGTYQRAVLISELSAPWPVDWVKPDTSASELGY